jgi:peptidyl-prolyl cis-trans isomerase B (cyclophilin B)
MTFTKLCEVYILAETNFLTNFEMKKLFILFSILGLLFMFSGCTDFEFGAVSDLDLEGTEAEIEAGGDPVQLDSETYQSSNEKFMQTAMPSGGDMIAVLTTNHGVMKAVLFESHTPETVKNFTELAKADKYDGTVFHRVIKNFMIQGGDFENRNGTGGHSYKGPGTMFEDEFHPDLSNIRGALSMANRGPKTNGSQFFIVHAEETSWLDGKHSVFGQVFEGLEVLETIANAETGFGDKPVKDIVLEDVEILVFEG